MPFSGKEGENSLTTTTTKLLTMQCGVTKEAAEIWNWWMKYWNSDFQGASPCPQLSPASQQLFWQCQREQIQLAVPSGLQSSSTMVPQVCSSGSSKALGLCYLNSWCEEFGNFSKDILMFWNIPSPLYELIQHNLNFMSCFHHLLKPLKWLLRVFTNVQATWYSSKCYFPF